MRAKHPWLALLLILAILVPAFQTSAGHLDFLGVTDVAEATDFLGLTFSPDGRHAYTLGDQPSVFDVAEVGGEFRLTFVAHIELPDHPFSDRRRLVFSADGEFMFAYRGFDGSSHDPRLPHDDLLTYRRSPSTGRLTLLDARDHENANFTLAAEDQYLYAVHERFDGLLSTLRVSERGLDLVVDKTASDLTGGVLSGEVEAVASSLDGERLFVGLSDGHSIGVFERDDEGSLELAHVLSLEGESAQFENFIELTPTADGRQLFANAKDGFSPVGSITILEVDQSTRELRFDGILPASPWLVRSPDDRYLVAKTEGQEILVAYERDPSTGVVTEVATVDLEALSQIGRPVFSPTADALFVPAAHGVWTLPWSAETGPGTDVTPVEVVDQDLGVFGFASIDAHPGGEFVYTPDAVFRRMDTGLLEFEGGLSGVGEGRAFSPDGAHLYGSGLWEIRAFDIDPLSGQPALIQTLTIGVPGDPDTYLYDLQLTDDGRRLIAHGLVNLAVFERDADTGLVTPGDTFVAGDAGTDFNRIRVAMVSPDGRHLYASVDTDETFPYPSTMLLFDVDPDSGELSYRRSIADVGLLRLMTPDGRHLVVEQAENLAVFGRESATGEIELVQTFQPPVSLASSEAAFLVEPDGRFVVMPLTLGRLALYLRDADTGRLQLLEILDNSEVGVEGLASATTLDPVHGTVYTAEFPGRIAAVQLSVDGPCEPSFDHLCLGDERFEARLEWRDFEGNTGTAHPASVRTEDSGVLWFFSETNWEAQIKVLDACGLNQRYWVFASAATNVETTLTVTDRLTGEERTYTNPLGRLAPAITDTDAFSGCDVARASVDTSIETATEAPRPPVGGAAGESKSTADRVEKFHVFECEPNPTRRCLQFDPSSFVSRFEVEVEWRDGAGNSGLGRVAPGGTDDSVLFWFFGPDNWEVLVKVLDGCALNGHFWVLGAATTDVEYTLRVTDSVTGEVREYDNPLGQAASALADIEAFSTCE